MSWTCHGQTQADMVHKLMHHGILKTRRIADAMKAVDRMAFLPPGSRTSRNAYEDSPQAIGYGVTISAPHMHAHCLELLEPYLKPPNKVLDVGSGSGYLTAVFGLLVHQGGGRVVGVEHIPLLVEQSRQSMESLPVLAPLLNDGTVSVLVADGREGYEAEAPYDAIHVGAAAERVPQELVDQLKPGGRMLLPCGPDGGEQHLMVVDKDIDGNVSMNAEMGVRYVPLTSSDVQLAWWRR